MGRGGRPGVGFHREETRRRHLGAVAQGVSGGAEIDGVEDDAKRALDGNVRLLTALSVGLLFQGGMTYARACAEGEDLEGRVRIQYAGRRLKEQVLKNV